MQSATIFRRWLLAWCRGDEYEAEQGRRVFRLQATHGLGGGIRSYSFLDNPPIRLALKAQYEIWQEASVS